MITDYYSAFLFISKLQLYFNHQNIIGIATGESFSREESMLRGVEMKILFHKLPSSCLLLRELSR